MDNLSGKVIRGYELREKIGEGGFGAVYRAFQPVVERAVAVKIIHAAYSNQPEFVRRFEQEAQTVARLEHIHIVPLYDYWRDPDGAYLVMRLLEEGNVGQTLRLGPWQLEEATRLVEQISSALHHAHRRGVVHRDIKPENILIDASNNFILTDFGIAIDVVNPQPESLENLSFGSPAYISPEQITSGEISPMADVYSIGILLYELLTGALPFDVPTQSQILRSHVYEPVPSLKNRRPDLPGRLDTIIWRATSKAPNARYLSVLSLASDLQELVTSTEPAQEAPPAAFPAHPKSDMGTVDLSAGMIAEPVELHNPYKGLRAFEESDAADFFGRDESLDQLLQKLNASPPPRFLAVVGPSGSGKSSLVKAALIPAIRQGKLSGSEDWFIATMVPGSSPVQELSEALLGIAINKPDDLLSSLTNDETGLLECTKTLWPGDSTELVLVIDQFEEVFTLLEDGDQRIHFLQLLHHAVTAPDSMLRVIVTLRADFYDRPLLYPAFGKLMREHTEVVLPLSQAELEQAIASPAIRAGLLVESGLSTIIANDVGQQPGALPLLQYALTELFERKVDKLLTLEAYQEIGGISGALVRRAEEIYDDLEAVEKDLARQVFLRLITLEEQSEATRRRVFWAEVISVADNKQRMQNVLDAFGKYRLFTFDRDPQTRTPTIEVAHEALIREWERLKTWIEENRNRLHIQHQLATSTAEWLQSNRDESFLASGARLAQFEALLIEKQLALTEHERQYVEHGIALRERSLRRIRLIAVTLAVFSVLALAFAVYAIDQRNEANEASSIAREERDRANSETRLARSRELAAAAIANLEQTDLALLLSNLALEFADTFEARSSLLTALQSNHFLSYYLPGHEDAVRTVAFSPDGQTLVSGSRDNMVIRWDLQTRQQMIPALIGHTDKINSVAFSPDGTLIASGSSDQSIRIWDAANGDLVEEFVGHTDEVWSVAFNPQGTMLTSGSADGTIILWDMTTGQIVGNPLTGHIETVFSVEFSPDGTLIASGGADQTVRLWDTATGEAVGDPLTGHKNWVLDVAFSPDGQLLLSSGLEANVFYWNIEEQKPFAELGTGQNGWTRSIAFSADGQILATANTDGTIRLWEASTGVPLSNGILQAHVSDIWTVAFSPDSTILASGGLDKNVLIWDISAPLPLQPPAHMRLPSSAEVMAAVPSPDGQWVAVAEVGESETNPAGIVKIWDRTGNLAHTLTGHAGPVTDVAWTSDSKQLVSTSGDTALMLWDVDSGDMIGAPWIAHSDTVRRALFLENNQTVISVGDDSQILFWDTNTGMPKNDPLVGQASGILSLALGPEERWLATGGRNGLILLWDLDEETPEGIPFSGHTNAVTDLVFTSDGRQLISSSRDWSIIIWDLETGQPEGQPLTEHTDWVLSMDLSPDGHTLASSSRDTSIILWDMASGRPIGPPLSNHRNWVNSVAFNPEDGTLVSGSRDAEILVWAMDISVWRQFTCEIANRQLTHGERLLFDVDDAADRICPQSP